MVDEPDGSPHLRLELFKKCKGIFEHFEREPSIVAVILGAFHAEHMLLHRQRALYWLVLMDVFAFGHEVCHMWMSIHPSLPWFVYICPFSRSN